MRRASDLSRSVRTFCFVARIGQETNLINFDLPYSLLIEPKHAQAGAICDSAPKEGDSWVMQLMLHTDRSSICVQPNVGLGS